MTRIARSALPAAFALAGAILLGLSLATGSAAALAAAALLAVLLLALVADPPLGDRDPRLRAAARLAAAAGSLALAAVAAIAVLAQGIALEERWAWTAAGAGAAALLLLVPVLVLDRSGLEAPFRRTERTALLRGAAVCAVLAGALVLSGEVLSPAAAALGLAYAVIAALEAVAMARPGGAGLRRLPTPAELDAVEAAVATGPPEVIGHRRVVVRMSGGAEYLSLEVLLRTPATAQRTAELRAQLERAIRGALPDVVVSVRVRVGELPPPAPEDTTRLDLTRPFDADAEPTPDDQPTAALAEQPTEPGSGAVLPSAPWPER